MRYAATCPACLADDRTLDVVTNSDGLEVACRACGAGEDQVQAAVLTDAEPFEEDTGLWVGRTPTTWAAVDLGPLLEGGELEAPPTMLARTDGPRLLYAGRIHAVVGEPEAGKGWLALHACAERLAAGERVLYLDFEDGPASIVERLLALGVDREVIGARFAYVRPDEPLIEGGSLLDLDLALISGAPTLVVVDGMTEALAVNGLDLRDNTDVARFLSLLPRRLARSGAAVLLLDHVVKDKESRGRFAIGAQHKLAGIDVSYTLTNVDPFGRGRNGLSTLKVGKDRPGHVREHQGLGGHIAELRLSSEEGSVALELAAPAAAGGTEFWPTRLMEKVSRAVEDQPGINKRGIRDLPGKSETLDLALSVLITEGFVRPEREGKAQAHYSVKPFREADET